MPSASRFFAFAQVLCSGLGESGDKLLTTHRVTAAECDDFAMTQVLHPVPHRSLLELTPHELKVKRHDWKTYQSLRRALIQEKINRKKVEDNQPRAPAHAAAHHTADAEVQDGYGVETQHQTGHPQHDAGQHEAGQSHAQTVHSESHHEAGQSHAQTVHNEGHHEAEHDAGHGHTHGFIALLFFFGVLTVGSLLLIFFERYCPAFQSTNVLFLCGSLVSLLHDYNSRRAEPVFTDWFDSVDMWQRISPHMLFFAFLPVLIFGEAMQMKTTLFKKNFAQIAILACPGVLIGTFLVGSFAMYVLPYPWEWPVALAFGSVLSATDPVAVVALFNTLGVSPRLTMLVSGESLLNDGTAICVFTLMMNIIHGAQATPSSILSFFVHMCGSSVLFGCSIGLASCVVIGLCANGHHTSDSMIQFMVTLCCAYLSFFVTDKELSSSGVLAVVSSGLVVAHLAWPRFVNRETILEVWEAMLFIANTVIFFLGGLLFSNICIKRADHITVNDYYYLMLLYVALHFIRAFMMAVLWYPIQWAGDPLSVSEAGVMVWSGLRGAVGLAMAISFDLDPKIDPLKGSRMMFHVGGIAMLTMFINSGLTPALLRLLGLTRLTEFKGMLLDSFNSKMQTEIQEKFTKMRNSDDVRFAEVCDDVVHSLIPELRKGRRFTAPHDRDVLLSDPEQSVGRERSHAADFASNPLMQIYRECFVRLLTHSYWAMIEEGVLPKNYRVTQLLLQSCEESLDSSTLPLCDWAKIGRFADGIVAPSIWVRLMSDFSKTYIVDWSSTMFRDTLDLDVNLRKVICASLCFRAAHKKAREEMMHLFGQNSDAAAVVGIVHAESERQCEIVEAFVKKHADPDAVLFEKAKMTAQNLLRHKIHSVHHMKEQGMLNGMEAQLLEGESLAAVERVLHPGMDLKD